MDIVHELLVHGWCKITIGKEAENKKLNSEKIIFQYSCYYFNKRGEVKQTIMVAKAFKR
jgi:hypothetical protein